MHNFFLAIAPKATVTNRVTDEGTHITKLLQLSPFTTLSVCDSLSFSHLSQTLNTTSRLLLSRVAIC
ncbi:hypothetical protein P8452_72019 [Trifolium repens]|nr:hypothetical protein P8452_72019 [Trifolium repens]